MRSSTDHNAFFTTVYKIFSLLLHKRAVVSSLIFVFLIIVAASLFELINPFILKRIVDGLPHSIDNQSTTILIFVIAYGFLWILIYCLAKLKEYITATVCQRSLSFVSLKLFDQLHCLSLAFHTNKKMGMITTALSMAQQGLMNLYYGLFLFLLPALLSITAAIVLFSYYYGLIYGIILLFVALLYLLFTYAALEWFATAEKKYAAKEASVGAYFVDSLMNAETVKLFNNRGFEYEKFNELLIDRQQSAIEASRRLQIIGMVQSLFLGIGLTTILILSAYNIISGTLTPGDFILINGYVLQCIMPLSYFGFFIQGIRKSTVNLEKIIELLESTETIKNSNQLLPVPHKSPAIQFREVSFNYQPKTNAPNAHPEDKRSLFTNINFSIEAGEKVGIIGATGSGKSTIAKLLFRLYDPQSGSILLDDQDIRSLDQSLLQSKIAVVPQETMLFNNTIYYNIGYGNPAASAQDIQEVIKKAELAAFIDSLPSKEETLVGERGLALSGGERQRIGIARALLKKPSIFIFDEATSALDYETEKAIIKNIADVWQQTTTILITHRLSTLVYTDRIIVLDKGVISHITTYSELKDS